MSGLPSDPDSSLQATPRPPSPDHSSEVPDWLDHEIKIEACFSKDPSGEQLGSKEWRFIKGQDDVSLGHLFHLAKQYPRKEGTFIKMVIGKMVIGDQSDMLYWKLHYFIWQTSESYDVGD